MVRDGEGLHRRGRIRVALVVGRLAHAQGLNFSSGVSPGRLVSNVLTWTVMLIAALEDVLG
jgi:uncharacterized membrane protein YecN with MAPEG domain